MAIPKTARKKTARANMKKGQKVATRRKAAKMKHSPIANGYKAARRRAGPSEHDEEEDELDIGYCPEHSTPLDQSIAELTDCVDRVRVKVSELGARLEPVLSGEDSGKKMARPEPSCGLQELIIKIWEMAAQTEAELDSIAEQLQL